MPSKYKIIILPGDGVGREVVPEGVKVLKAVQETVSGLDLVFECAGEQETLDEAVRLLKPGGTLLMVGIPEGDRIGLIADELRRKELTVRYVRRQNECMHEAIDILDAGRDELSAMITHRFPLDKAQEAFELVAEYRDGVVKGMIHIPD